MSDEALYLTATQEVESENKDPAVWAKSMALTEGDMEKAKYKYINIRVESLREEAKKDAEEQEKQQVQIEEDNAYIEAKRLLAKIRSTNVTLKQCGYCSKLSLSDKKLCSCGELLTSTPPSKEVPDFNLWRVNFANEGTIWEYSAWLKQTLEQFEHSEKLNRESQKQAEEEFLSNFIPIEKFSTLKGIEPKKIIEMIKDGFYQGRIKNDKWYVSKQELHANDQALSPINKPYEANPKNDNSSDYIPVDEFAEIKGIKSEKIINMIRDGFYKGRLINEQWFIAVDEIGVGRNSNHNEPFYGFTWWKIYGCLVLVGGLFIPGYFYRYDMHEGAVTIIVLLLIINTALGVMILRFNKYAFLTATILSFNPIWWIINGVYLRNRWSETKVNN